MCPLSPTTFPDWQNQQQADPAFVAAERELEPGYQVARLRFQRGLTHTCPGRTPAPAAHRRCGAGECWEAQLAEMVGTRQPSIARLEYGLKGSDL